MSKDMHTEHCCRHPHHGCKYGDEDCSVVTGYKQQSFTCERCSDEGITSLEELEASLNILVMSESDKREAFNLGLNKLNEITDPKIKIYSMYGNNITRYIHMKQYLMWLRDKSANMVYWK